MHKHFLFEIVRISLVGSEFGGSILATNLVNCSRKPPFDKKVYRKRFWEKNKSLLVVAILYNVGMPCIFSFPS